MATIGAGAGTIVITHDIALTAPIVIAGGGSYLIQGVAPGITVDCNGDRQTFNIISVSSCTIRDLSVDARDLTTIDNAVIYAVESSVSLENLWISGDDNNIGRGIVIEGSYAWISNCHASDLRCGVYMSTSSHALHEIGNTFLGNLIGILGQGSNNTVANNILEGNKAGIQCQSHNSTYTGNNLVGRTVVGSSCWGIYVTGDYNVFTGNLVTSYNATGGGTGYGMTIHSNADETVVVGNTFLFNDVNCRDDSSTTILSGNNDS